MCDHFVLLKKRVVHILIYRDLNSIYVQTLIELNETQVKSRTEQFEAGLQLCTSGC